MTTEGNVILSSISIIIDCHYLIRDVGHEACFSVGGCYPHIIFRILSTIFDLMISIKKITENKKNVEDVYIT